MCDRVCGSSLTLVLYCGNLLSILSVLFVFHRLDPSSIFTTAYTSGSTGAPKGCVFTTNT